MDYVIVRNEEYLKHHGILGQKWGDRNGPPYPLSGGDYSKQEREKINQQRNKGNSIYTKKHFDKVLKKGQNVHTLSYSKDRTKDVDMFYATFTKADQHEYGALFNRKIPIDITDENGNVIGTNECYKYKISNELKRDISIASEDSGADAFIKLYSTNRDFSNFVRDANRMQSHFVADKYKFSGYREAADALNRIRQTDKPNENDLRIAYRMFNYVIPSDGGGNGKRAHDIEVQRTKLFKLLKESGYSAMLDTNDAIYGGFKANAPIIVFDQEAVALSAIKQTGIMDKTIDSIALAINKTMGR